MDYKFYDLGAVILGIGIVLIEYLSPLTKEATKEEKKNKKLLLLLGYVLFFGGVLYNLFKYDLI